MLGTQTEALWPELTPKEHIHIFAQLHGYGPEELEDVTEQVCSQIRFTQEDRAKRSCDLSGGMRRRLSVGLAVIGHHPLQL